MDWVQNCRKSSLGQLNDIGNADKLMNDVTTDAFLDGAITVLQPKKGGHRAGMDALLLAATMPESQKGRVADFGAGCGIVGLAAAHFNSDVMVDLVECEPEMAGLARKSLTFPENSRVSSRVGVVEANITLDGKARRDGGLFEDTYDLILTNPPYNDAGRRPSPNPLRRLAHDMPTGFLNQWVRTSAACLKGKGRLHLIVRPSNLPELLQAFEGRFGGVQILPIHAKSEETANRLIVTAIKGAKGELKILPAFTVHEQSGEFTPLAEKIFRGRARLSGL